MKVLERRPILVVLAGPNGAGKSTFYDAHLRSYGFRFVNADELSRLLDVDPYSAAEVADQIRRELLAQKESFAFETVFSDPVGARLEFMKDAEVAGYTVVLFFIGIDNSELSEQRVAIRVAQGGHDVPQDKLKSRFARVMKNLAHALIELSNVRVYDNSDLSAPYRLVALLEDGTLTLNRPTPAWLKPLLPAE